MTSSISSLVRIWKICHWIFSSKTHTYIINTIILSFFTRQTDRQTDRRFTLLFVFHVFSFRLNLNCDDDAWKELNDSVHKDEEVLLDREEDLELDGEDGNKPVNDLDVLLKSLWEGEDITENTVEDAENAFGDSVLDEDLNDMEIKIYTQITPMENTASTEEKEKSFIEDSLPHSDLDKDIDGLSTSDWRGEDSIVKANESLNCCDIAQHKETLHPSSPTFSLSSVDTINIDNKVKLLYLQSCYTYNDLFNN